MNRVIQATWWQGRVVCVIALAISVAVLSAFPLSAWADNVEEDAGEVAAVENAVALDVQSEAISSEVEPAPEPEPKPAPEPEPEPEPKPEPELETIVDEQLPASEDNEFQSGQTETEVGDEGQNELLPDVPESTLTEPAEGVELEVPEMDADDESHSLECEITAEDATAASAETGMNGGEDPVSFVANANNGTAEVSVSAETGSLSEKSSSKVTLTTQSNQYWHLWSDGDPFTLGSSVVIRWENVSSTVVFAYKVCVYDSKGASVFSKRYPNSGTYSSNASYTGSVSVPTTTSMPSGQWRAVIYFYNASGTQIDAPEINFFVKDTPITFGTDNLGKYSVTAGDSTTLFLSGVKGSNLIYEWYWNTNGDLTSGTKITSANSSSYTVSNIPYSFSGRYYYCRVSNYSGDANFNYIKIYGIGPAQFFVSKRKVSAPTANTGLVYSGSALTGVASSANYTRSGTYSATNAGSYTAYVGLADSANCTWADGTTGSKSIYWKISPKSLNIPKARKNLTYNGYDHVGIEGYSMTGSIGASSPYSTVGTTHAANAGSYSATLTLSDAANYQWSDGTTTQKKIFWSIARKQLDLPTVYRNLVYNGKKQNGVVYGANYTLPEDWYGWSSAMRNTVIVLGRQPKPGYVLSGVCSAQSAGSYTAYATLDDANNFQWANGTTGKSAIKWAIAPLSIGKASVTGVASKTYTGKAQTQNPTVKVGGLTATRSLAYKNNVATGTAAVTITGTGNYTGSVVKTFTIMPRSIAKATVSGIKDKTYTGGAITQALSVALSGYAPTFKVSYKNNVNAGTATVTITGTGNYTGSVAKTFKIAARSIAKAVVSGVKNKVYTGKALKQSPSVRLSGYSPTFKVSYKKNVNVGKATMVITGTGNYAGSIAKAFKIKPAKLTASGIALAKTSVAYTGKAVKPKVTVKAGSKTLKAGKDYTVVYAKGSKAVGSHKVKVVGKGNYAGSASKSYVVNPKATVITKTRAYDAAYDALVGGGIEVAWRKVPAQIDGYEVWLSKSKRFPSSGLKEQQFAATSAVGKKASFKGQGLKKGVQYYVKIRTYKKASGKTYYSAWSKVKGVKTKKSA